MEPPFNQGLARLARGPFLSPFSRLRQLLANVEPGLEPIDLALGEPREGMPGFVIDRVREAAASFARYPPIRGIEPLRQAIAGWIDRRYGLRAPVDPDREVLPVSGSREGLCFAVLCAAGRRDLVRPPALLLPNPHYVAYVGAALAANAEPVFLDATAATGHLPDLDALSADVGLLERTVGFILCTPANPQGAVADRAYLARAIELARRYDFMLFVDECYSEIYADEAPPGGLEVASLTPDRFRNVVVLNSLSKRSNLPGLRSGFCAGDPEFIDRLAELRNVIGPQISGPLQHASAAVWADDAHVEALRRAYATKYAICDELLEGRWGYRRPAGGFFLWLDIAPLGDSEATALALWSHCGVKVLPGAYIAHAGPAGHGPGDRHVRVALVHGPALIREALQRIIAYPHRA